MAETGKICPFLSAFNQETNIICAAEECAIWDAVRNCCSFRK